MKPKTAILRTDGINCDEELFYAFEAAGGIPEMVHVNRLLEKKKNLDDYQILGLPGGFSYGDDILSAKILANELSYRLGEEIHKFIEQDKLIIGICNGFQVLIRMGYLPWRMKPAEDVSLIFNNTGRFECRWVKLRIEHSNSVFTRGLEGKIFEMPVAHGEGRLVVKDKEVNDKLKKGKNVAVRYAGGTNPNGSCDDIAGLTDVTGRIFGLMPHPERNILPHHHPNWHRYNLNRQKFVLSTAIFQNAVEYFV